MELYLKIYKAKDLEKLQDLVFFENDEYIDTLRFKAGVTEYFIYDSYDGPDVRDDEIDSVFDAIQQIKKVAPSSRIAYISNQDEGTGWMMCACSFEDEKIVHKLYDFYLEDDFASRQWFASVRETLGLPAINHSSAKDFLVDENGVLYKYKGKGGEIVIPEMVTAIDGDAFREKKNIIAVTFPAGLVKIGPYAFYSCKNLESVKFPDRLETIEERAFYGCDKLSTITIPASLKKVGYEAFGHCQSLSKIILQDETQALCFGESAIKDCPMLVDEDGFLIVGSWILKYFGAAGDIIIPDGITCVASFAFVEYGFVDKAYVKKNRITSITFPDSLKSIGLCAFAGSRDLVAVEIPNAVESIDAGAFEECVNLESVTLHNPDVVIGNNAFSNCPKLADDDGFVRVNGKLFTYHGTKEDVVLPAGTVEFGTFAGNETIKSIVIPEGVTEIKRSTFARCKNLESIQLPESLEYIDAQAFEHCNSLKEIVIPKGVEAIGTSAFGNCENLVRVEMSHTTQLYHSFYKCTGLTDQEGRIIVCGVLDYYPQNKKKKIVIPKDVKVIEDGVLRYSESLEELHIPASVESIGRLPEGITIYGKAGSYAEGYAKENNIPFVAK